MGARSGGCGDWPEPRGGGSSGESKVLTKAEGDKALSSEAASFSELSGKLRLYMRTKWSSWLDKYETDTRVVAGLEGIGHKESMNIALAKQNPHEEFATAMSFEAVHGNEFYCPPQEGSAATIVMTTEDRKTSPM
ncbi:uncharacterized protein L203_104139 [Cryptococcus depauperatus CBS 7841]|uniref:Uncharacterized protein n=1 Tax=Cryptococcus depauperatus CBS 7841 TaxID=1295531 RepID=A0AAJ8JV73_9TREE